MINSLSKDSHITQLSRLQKSAQHSDSSARRQERETKKRATVNNFNINTRKPAEIHFSGFSNANKIPKIYTSEGVKKFLVLASESQIVFSAIFAAGLACVMRPAAIMSLPGKKNKDDKKYASAHSIASGLIGYATSLVISSPIAAAVKKLEKDPKKYIGKNFEYLGQNAETGVLNGKPFKTATKYLNMVPEAIFAVPKAIITVSLIPPILKYVFGWEKKKPATTPKGTMMTPDYSALNFKSADAAKKKVFQNFMGGNVQQDSKKTVAFTGAQPTKSKFFDPLKSLFAPFKALSGKITDQIAYGLGKVISHDRFKNVVDKTEKSKVDVVKHISALISIIISSMYMKKTLENDQLEPEKRTTLAINQGIVCGLSTILGYSFDKAVDRPVKEFTKKFLERNVVDADLAAKYADGIKAASSMMIFGMMYRFIAPVLVTPIANAIGNQIQANKEAKLKEGANA